MTKIRIYHNPRCRKSREALALIEGRGEIEIIDYLKEGFNISELETDIKKANVPIEAFVRKGEAIYKSEYKGKVLDEKGWIKAFVKHPKLFERPLVVVKNRSVLGRPPENVLNLF